MSTQPILIVIGIAIAVNLVIMGGLVVTLIARRRASYATADGIAEPAQYRSDAMTTTPPTTSRAISFIDEDADDEDAYERASEDYDDDVSATEPADYRPLRPVMSDQDMGDVEAIPSFAAGQSPRAIPPPAPSQPTALPRQPAAAPGQPPLAVPRPVAVPPTVAGPRPVAGPAPDASPTVPAAPQAGDRLGWEVRLRDEGARLARYRRPVTVVLVEVDGMERLVTRLGPDAAERLVPPVGITLTRQARAADHIARIGLSRFAVLLPETDEIQAINYVERIRTECDRWLAAGAVATRLAIGWASPTPGGDLHSATRIAEDRLNADRRRAFVPAESDPMLSETPTSYPIDMYRADTTTEVELTPPNGLE